MRLGWSGSYREHSVGEGGVPLQIFQFTKHINYVDKFTDNSQSTDRQDLFSPTIVFGRQVWNR